MATKKQPTKNAATKAAPAKKAAAKTKAEAVKKGQVVKFIGWDGDAPEDADGIIEGMVGKVRSVSTDEIEVAIEIDGESVIVPFSPNEIAPATKADIAAAKELASDDEEDEDDDSDDDESDEDDDEDEESDEEEEEEDEESSYDDMSVSELRELCDERGVKRGGGKQAMIDRLIEADNSEGTEEEDEEEEDEEEEAPKPKSKSKSKAKVEVDEDDEEEEEEEEAPAKPARQPSLGKLADDGDKTAIRELTKRAKAASVDVDAYETWREIEREVKAAEKESSKPALVITSSVQDEIGENGKTAIAAAKKLVETAERTYFTLGGVLAFIDRNATYEKVKVGGDYPYQGKEGFESFCEDTLGIAYRKAKYLIAIYEAFTGANLTERKIQSIGWSKAKELVAILREEPDQADKWIETAKSVGTEQLKEKVKTRLTKLGAKVHGNAKTVKSVVCKFVVHEDEGEVVTEALALAKEQAETESDSAAFAYILKEWLAMQG